MLVLFDTISGRNKVSVLYHLEGVETFVPKPKHSVVYTGVEVVITTANKNQFDVVPGFFPPELETLDLWKDKNYLSGYLFHRFDFYYF